MIKDKEEKKAVLEEILKQMGGRVVENDLKPKTKMIVKAEGDSPEEAKEVILKKLSKIELPEEDEMGEMLPMDGEDEEMEDEEGEDDFMSELPEGLRKALMKKIK